MKFVKLHQNGREMLVNMSTVTEIYNVIGDSKSDLYFNFAEGGEQVRLNVDESLDEIYEKVKGNENVRN